MFENRNRTFAIKSSRPSTSILTTTQFSLQPSSPKTKMATVTLFLQTTSIATALLAAGGIATLTLFDTPILASQPASRALPSTRWLFSRGSHVFPTAAAVAGLGLGALAVLARRTSPQTLLLRAASGAGAGGGRGLLALQSQGGQMLGYAAAAVLCVSIAPWTMLVMVPNNFALIRRNAEKGGARSADSAAAAGSSAGEKKDAKARSALDSVRGEGEAAEFMDRSGPQGRTREETSEGEDEEVREMLRVFGRQNMVRAVLMGLGGVVGLVTALG